mmetsp:Transcript_19465/g.28299  ORF Transcript_19465/g.28299 Transcript_19465/m.28299 type:complete len:372 (+) Transcript_19465:39-1154(+)
MIASLSPPKSTCTFQTLVPRRTLCVAAWTSFIALNRCICQAFTNHQAQTPPSLGFHSCGRNILQQPQHHPNGSFHRRRGKFHQSIYKSSMATYQSSQEIRKSVRIRSRLSTGMATIDDNVENDFNGNKRTNDVVKSIQQNRNVHRKAVRPKQRMPFSDKTNTEAGRYSNIPATDPSNTTSSKSAEKMNGNTCKEGRDNSNLLLDLGPLVQGKLIKRPSVTIRSPYVADVEIVAEDCKGGLETTIVHAHSPALDVGGLCSPGATVFMSKRPPGGKTSHVIELVETTDPHNSNKDEMNSSGSVLIGAHPRQGEILAEEVLKRGLLQEYIKYKPASVFERKKTRSKNAKKEDGYVASDGVVLFKGGGGDKIPPP